MPMNLSGRSFLSLNDYSRDELEYLLALSKDYKSLKRAGVYPRRLEHKNVALVFEKPSTRTRCAFTVASVEEGAHPEFLGAGDIQMGKKESVADTARVLGRMFDGIQFRGRLSLTQCRDDLFSAHEPVRHANLIQHGLQGQVHAVGQPVTDFTAL